MKTNAQNNTKSFHLPKETTHKTKSPTQKTYLEKEKPHGTFLYPPPLYCPSDLASHNTLNFSKVGLSAFLYQHWLLSINGY